MEGTIDRKHGKAWIGPLVVGASAGYMLWVGWLRWMDVQLDYASQLYIPWRIASGDVLQRDIQTLFGPLSQSFHAWLFSIFGVGISTLVWGNLLLTLVAVAAIYRLAEKLAGTIAAAVSGIALVTLCALGRTMRTGNYCFITPYSYEQVHGLFLGVAAVCLLDVWMRRNHRRILPAVGCCVGLTWLCKPEPAVASTVAVALALLLSIRWRPLKSWLLDIAATAVGALVGPALFIASFCRYTTLTNAVAWTFNTWIVASHAKMLPFDRRNMGLDDPASRVVSLASLTLWWLLPLAATAVLAQTSRRLNSSSRLLIAALWCAILSGIGWYFRYQILAATPLRPMLVALLIAAAVWASRSLFAPSAATAKIYSMFLIPTVFALLLTIRIFLNITIEFYGFALAAPALVVTVCLLVGWLPKAMHTRWPNTFAVTLAGALGLIAPVTLAYVERSTLIFASQKIRMGGGADRFYADSRGRALSLTMLELASRARPESTVTPLPEGLIINYLLRLKTPSRYLVFNPSDAALLTESRLTADLMTHPPEFIILISKDNTEFGSRTFGTDYAAAIKPWIAEHYAPVHEEGPDPFTGPDHFGVWLYQLKP